MESFDLDPSARVFHIDTECYVIYIGSEPDDYRPFLRVGNSGDLPDKVTDYVNPIVITDTFTGNPLLESDNLGANSAVENRYIGDPKTVERLKDFVGRQSVSTEGFEYYHGAVTDTSGVYVYFFSDGNVTVKYGKSELFNLRRREQQDRHYLERARHIKNNFERNPLKYPRETFATPGFAFVDGTVAVFNKGEIGALRLWDDYFLDLARHGIDPDKLGAVVAQAPDLSLLRYVKRGRSKGSKITVVAEQPGAIRGFLDLFASDALKPLSYDLQKLGTKGVDGFATHHLESRDGRYLLTRSGSQLSMEVLVADKAKGGSADALLLRPRERTVQRGDQRIALPNGVPCLVTEAQPSEDELYRQYLPGKTTSLREILGTEAHAVLTSLVAFIDEARQKRDGSKFLRNARQTLKGLESPSDVLVCYCRNVATICSVLSQLDEYQSLGRQLTSAADQLRSDVGGLETVDTTLPVVADLYVTDEGMSLLFRFTGLLSQMKLGQAASATEKMQAAAEVTDHYQSERKRLMDLVAGLADPQVQLQKLMTKIAEEKQAEEAQEGLKEEEAATSSSSSKVMSAPQAGSQTGQSSKASDPKQEGVRGTGTGRRSPAEAARRAAMPARKPRRSGGRAGWIAAAAVLGIVVVALLLWFTGVIPRDLFTPGERADLTDGDPIVADGAQSAPGETAPGETAPGETAPGETAPGETAPGETAPGETAPGETAPGETAPGETAPGETGPGETAPGETAPGETAPGETAPGETAPGETAPGDETVPPPPPNMTEEEARETPAFSGAGGIEASIFDIIEMVNRIAVENGYRRMDNFDSEAPDPDWIYPGNVFVLPDQTRYTVERNDTLWDITVRFVRRSLNEDYRRYRELQDELNNNPENREDIVQQLENLAASAHVEELSGVILETVRELRQGE